MFTFEREVTAHLLDGIRDHLPYRTGTPPRLAKLRPHDYQFRKVVHTMVARGNFETAVAQLVNTMDIVIRECGLYVDPVLHKFRASQSDVDTALESVSEILEAILLAFLQNMAQLGLINADLVPLDAPIRRTSEYFSRWANVANEAGECDDQLIPPLESRVARHISTFVVALMPPFMTDEDVTPMNQAALRDLLVAAGQYIWMANPSIIEKQLGLLGTGSLRFETLQVAPPGYRPCISLLHRLVDLPWNPKLSMFAYFNLCSMVLSRGVTSRGEELREASSHLISTLLKPRIMQTLRRSFDRPDAVLVTCLEILFLDVQSPSGTKSWERAKALVKKGGDRAVAAAEYFINVGYFAYCGDSNQSPFKVTASEVASEAKEVTALIDAVGPNLRSRWAVFCAKHCPSQFEVLIKSRKLGFASFQAMMLYSYNISSRSERAVLLVRSIDQLRAFFLDALEKRDVGRVFDCLDILVRDPQAVPKNFFQPALGDLIDLIAGETPLDAVSRETFELYIVQLLKEARKTLGTELLRAMVPDPSPLFWLHHIERVPGLHQFLSLYAQGQKVIPVSSFSAYTHWHELRTALLLCTCSETSHYVKHALGCLQLIEADPSQDSAERDLVAELLDTAERSVFSVASVHRRMASLLARYSHPQLADLAKALDDALLAAVTRDSKIPQKSMVPLLRTRIAALGLEPPDVRASFYERFMRRGKPLFASVSGAAQLSPKLAAEFFRAITEYDIEEQSTPHYVFLGSELCGKSSLCSWLLGCMADNHAQTAVDLQLGKVCQSFLDSLPPFDDVPGQPTFSGHRPSKITFGGFSIEASAEQQQLSVLRFLEVAASYSNHDAHPQTVSLFQTVVKSLLDRNWPSSLQAAFGSLLSAVFLNYHETDDRRFRTLVRRVAALRLEEFSDPLSRLLEANIEPAVHMCKDFRDGALCRISLYHALTRLFAAEAARDNSMLDSGEFVEFFLTRSPLLLALCDVCSISGNDSLSDSLLTLFHSHTGLAMCSVMELIVPHEVSQAQSAMNLFRSSSVTMKILLSWIREEMQGYLIDVLGPALSALKIATTRDDSDLAALFPQLEQQFSQHPRPQVIRTFVQLVSEAVSARFGSEAVRPALGVLLVLRVVCPVVVSPQRIGLAERPPVREYAAVLRQFAVYLQKRYNSVLAEMDLAENGDISGSELQSNVEYPAPKELSEAEGEDASGSSTAVDPQGSIQLPADTRTGTSSSGSNASVSLGPVTHDSSSNSEAGQSSLHKAAASVAESRSNPTSEQADERSASTSTSGAKVSGSTVKSSSANSDASARMTLQGHSPAVKGSSMDAQLSAMRQVFHLLRRHAVEVRVVLIANGYGRLVPDMLDFLMPDRGKTSVSTGQHNRGSVSSSDPKTDSSVSAGTESADNTELNDGIVDFLGETAYAVTGRSICNGRFVPEMWTRNLPLLIDLSDFSDLADQWNNILSDLNMIIAQRDGLLRKIYVVNCPLRAVASTKYFLHSGSRSELKFYSTALGSLELEDIPPVLTDAVKAAKDATEAVSFQVHVSAPSTYEMEACAQIGSQYLHITSNGACDVIPLSDISLTEETPASTIVVNTLEQRIVIRDAGLAFVRFLKLSSGNVVSSRPRSSYSSTSRLSSNTKTSSSVPDVIPGIGISPGELLFGALLDMVDESPDVRRHALELYATLPDTLGLRLNVPSLQMALPPSQVVALGTAAASRHPELAVDVCTTFAKLGTRISDHAAQVASPWIPELVSDPEHMDAGMNVIKALIEATIEAPRKLGPPLLEYVCPRLHFLWPPIIDMFVSAVESTDNDEAVEVLSQFVANSVVSNIVPGVYPERRGHNAREVAETLLRQLNPCIRIAVSPASVNWSEHPQATHIEALLILFASIPVDYDDAKALFPDAAFLLLTYVGVGTARLRKAMHKMCLNYLDAFVQAPSHELSSNNSVVSLKESYRRRLRAMMGDVVGPRGLVLFGVQRGSNAWSFDAYTDFTPEMSNHLCRLVSETIALVFSSRTPSSQEIRFQLTSRLLEFINVPWPALQRRSILGLHGAIRFLLPDETVGQLLVSLSKVLDVRDALETRGTLTCAFLRMFSETVDCLPETSEYQTRMFWFAVVALATSSTAIRSESVRLLCQAIKLAQFRGAFRTESMAEFFMDGSPPWLSELRESLPLDVPSGQSNFHIAVAQLLIPALQDTRTQAITLECCDVLAMACPSEFVYSLLLYLGGEESRLTARVPMTVDAEDAVAQWLATRPKYSDKQSILALVLGCELSAYLRSMHFSQTGTRLLDLMSLIKDRRVVNMIAPLLRPTFLQLMQLEDRDMESRFIYWTTSIFSRSPEEREAITLDYGALDEACRELDVRPWFTDSNLIAMPHFEEFTELAREALAGDKWIVQTMSPSKIL